MTRYLRTVIGVMMAILMLSVSGCIGDQGASSGQAEDEHPGEPEGDGSSGVLNRSLEIHWNGTVSRHVCPIIGQDWCTGADLGDGDDWSPEHLVPVRNATPVRVDVNLTWTPETPLTEELTFKLQRCTGSPGDAECGYQRMTTGVSRLRIQADALGNRSQGRLALEVQSRDPWPTGAANGSLSPTSQDFVVRGRVLLAE